VNEALLAIVWRMNAIDSAACSSRLATGAVYIKEL
jgi:hypothetical protein